MNYILGYAIWAMQIISFVGIAYVPVAFLMRKKLSPLRRTANFLFLSWVIVVLYVTVFGNIVWGVTVFRPGNIPANINLISTITEWSKNSGRIVEQLLENIIMFMPIGFLMPMVVKKARKIGSAFCSILLLTSFIEVSQYLLGTRAADIADILMNTLGGIIGYVVFRGCNYVLKNKSWWKSLCKSDALSYSRQSNKGHINNSKTAGAYLALLILAISSYALFTHFDKLINSSYSQMSSYNGEKTSSSEPYKVSHNDSDMEIYQYTEEDLQIDQKLQEIREQNIELNQRMLEEAKEKGIEMPEGAMFLSSPVDVLGYRVERPFFNESQLRSIYKVYEEYLLTRYDEFEPYDEDKYTSTTSNDPRISALLYDPESDRTKGALKDYQADNLYAMEAMKKTGEYTTIILGRASEEDKWKVILEGSYYELRPQIL
ncbi:VanZ family protein [Sinanaerobacter sp. ZZT-01]|uniref:VanZ family protein n=1 Tax=Sinanaerobacter sp. ZZT-01 TaxID=3111540 RepID=UPI002D77AA4D|nr:VanZ family protein [Sinanaerobacter sp. ZZT-01]WRR94333.1 VanZ family protein [Sinanaerobacter sp. ZZT-01]